MAPNFLALATTLDNLGARRLLAQKVNFVPWNFQKNQWKESKNSFKQFVIFSLSYKFIKYFCHNVL